MAIEQLIVRQFENLKCALELLNKNGLGVLFVINDDETLVGVVTDGDIRRALLNGNELTTKIAHVMNINYTAMLVGTDNQIVLDALNEKVKIIPLVDENGRLVDYSSINKIRRISVASPLLNGNELAYVTDCIKSNWISSQGKYVRKFEENFKDYHDGMTALAVSNGTVALHLALISLGITEGDEVIVPDFTFAASVNSIIYTGAIPVLIDVEADTWNIDPKKVEEKITPRTKAIMPVHLYGHPCEMDKLCSLAKKYNLFIIEDCAEALGSYYKKKPVGTFGDVSTFSFFGNKTITTGEGGMVLFRNPEIAEKAAVLRDHGMQKNKRYWHSDIGYNYRLTNIQAAIGVAQFERLQEFVSVKRQIARAYNKVLSKYMFFLLPSEREDTINSYWLYTFVIKDGAPFTREELINHLNTKGVETRPVFFSVHTMPPYLNYGKDEELTVSKMVSKRGMSLPSSVNLTEVELTFVCDEIENFARTYHDIE